MLRDRGKNRRKNSEEQNNRTISALRTSTHEALVRCPLLKLHSCTEGTVNDEDEVGGSTGQIQPAWRPEEQ